ncbi:hypothetical protein LCGC14_1396420, partial [marine sediment metagenome]
MVPSETLTVCAASVLCHMALPLAVVVLHEGESMTSEEVKGYVGEYLAGLKR